MATPFDILLLSSCPQHFPGSCLRACEKKKGEIRIIFGEYFFLHTAPQCQMNGKNVGKQALDLRNAVFSRFNLQPI